MLLYYMISKPECKWKDKASVDYAGGSCSLGEDTLNLNISHIRTPPLYEAHRVIEALGNIKGRYVSVRLVLSGSGVTPESMTEKQG